MIDYESLKKKMEKEYELLYKEIYVHNSYNCKDGELKDKIVIDIGANTGYFSIYAIMMGAKKVYAYEPNKNNFIKLIERTKDFDNIITINKAVHRTGVKKCYTVHDNHPLLNKEENGVRCEVRVAENEDDGTIDCVSLKEILDEINEQVILKTDCEGSEYDLFLCSSKETLQKIYLIYAEFHDKLHPNQEYNPAMLTDFITENGFENIKREIKEAQDVEIKDEYISLSEGKNGTNNYYRKFKRKASSRTVNIIIPTYKRYSMLRRALDSVLGQTYQDINVLVVSDGKDLNTEKIVNEYVKKHTKIKFNYYDIEHEGKLGGRARMCGIEQLSNDGYVCFLDDDNVLYPKYVKLMYDNIEAEIKDIVFCNVLLKEDGLIKSIPQGAIPTLEDIDSLNILVSNKIAKLCKDKWIHDGGRITHDYDFISECLKHSGFNYIPAVLAEHNFTDPTYVEEIIDYDLLLEKFKKEDAVVYEEIFGLNMYACTDEELKDAVVIDIGANKGYFSIYAIMHGAKMVYAYEPNKDNYARLIENIKGFNNITPFNFAVHHPNVHEVYSVGSGMNSTVIAGKNKDSVQCISLERIINIVPQENLILKTDCEGSEYDILLPCPTESLRKFKVIYAEFHNEIHSNKNFNFKMLNEHIEKLGFNRTKSAVQTFVGHHTFEGKFIPSKVKEANETSKFIHKNKPMVYDLFPFFNELDLLEIRMEELYDVVDKFVITEANATHSGNPKPLYLTENLKRFEKYKDKIELRIVDLLSPLPSSNMNPDWMREHIQRNDALRYLNDVCRPDDIIIVSDVDEIPRREAIQQYIQDKTDSVGVFVQDRFMYYLNYKNITTDEPQLNSKIAQFKLLDYYGLHDINAIRYSDKENLMPTYRIENGGWHFTFQGGIEKVIEKVKAFAHQEYNIPEKVNYERMMNNFEEGKDVYDAKTTWKTIEIDDNFPEVIKKNKQKYIDNGWIKSDKKIQAKEMVEETKSDKKNILCSISTRGRYDTTLPLAINSVVMQELLPDALVIFDDNDKPEDIRNMQHYEYLLRMLDEKSVKWSVVFGEKKGQHYNHQKANSMGYKFVWRIDDDTIPEPNVLKKLYSEMQEGVGAVGGSVLTPPFAKGIKASGKIEDINSEANLQWDYIKETKEVDHLHCSFIYRAGIVDYDLNLSRVAHREETIFSYAIKKKGYKILITDCITWHLRNRKGGIRTGDENMFEHDDRIFNGMLNLWNVKNVSDKKIVVLDAGIGDHYAFKTVLPKLKEKYEKLTLAVCYPGIFFDEENIELISIADAINILGDIGSFNIYVWMEKNKWKQSLSEAFLKMYL